MSIIRHYVHSIFESLPRTSEMVQLKQELLLNMEKRYDQLIAEKNNEQQATALVLTEFSQIAKYLTQQSFSTDEVDFNEASLDWSDDDVQEFMSHRSKFALAIASGISLILIAPAKTLFIQEIAQFLPFMNRIEPQKLIALSFIPALLLIAIAIGLFVVFGLKEHQYNVGDNLISLNKSTRSYLTQEKKEFNPRFIKAISAGVLLCIASLVFLFLSLILFGAAKYWLLIFLFSFVSIGTFLLVFFGIIHLTYDQLLSTGDYTLNSRASERLTTRVANILFPVAAGLYVISGLMFHTWSPGWMIFPILGIGFGIFATILENVHLFHPKNKETKRR